ncbi:MAG TPA: dihydroneopterin aldolase [Acidimicrobiales bacterium]|nr:dihydroneopterin aldolase [Acidimicrobiales bacterium]
MTDDRIEIRGLRLVGLHGLLPEERSRTQPFEIDLDLEVDMDGATASDALADTADYGAAIGVAAAVVAGPPHDLLESLAGAIASAVLADARVIRVTVAVRKLRPPVPYDVDSTGVRLSRSRPSG